MKKLGDVSVGTTLYLNEGGTRVPYLVVNQGRPSSIYHTTCDGTWLLRYALFSKYKFGETADNDYSTSMIPQYLLDNVFSKYDDDIQNVINTVKIPYFNGTSVKSGSNGLECKIFVLSLKELGKSDSNAPSDGATLNYFSGAQSSKRIAYYNNNATAWWTRSPVKVNADRYTFYSFAITTSGDPAELTKTSSQGIRPTIVCPKDLIVDNNNNITADFAPSEPTSITVPTSPVPAGSSILISWGVGSNATGYILKRRVNGGSWQTVYTGTNTSYQDIALSTWTEVEYQIASTGAGFTSSFVTSSVVTILPYVIKNLTVPSIIMQGQEINILWMASDASTDFVLERKADNGEWTQIYSGGSVNYTDTPGSWSSVQYRVKAGADGVFGEYSTSSSIPVVSASALVISGQDGDLGTLINDVPYTISTDTGNQISVKTTVNGALIFQGNVVSGMAEAIPVLDLVNGEGTIVIEASVETTSGIVSSVRRWTYHKDKMTFPNSGSPAELTKNGETIWPKTLAECVRLPGGRTLDEVMGFPAQVFVGSYIGTGTYGEGDPNEVTVPFKPQIVFVSNGSVGTTIPMIRPLLKAESSADLTVAWTDDGVSWSATSAAAQMNANGTDYIVVAFG